MDQNFKKGPSSLHQHLKTSLISIRSCSNIVFVCTVFKLSMYYFFLSMTVISFFFLRKRVSCSLSFLVLCSDERGFWLHISTPVLVFFLLQCLHLAFIFSLCTLKEGLNTVKSFWNTFFVLNHNCQIT